MSLNARRCLLSLFAMLLLSGCGAEQPQPGLGEWFRETQQNTETPHGNIVPESVREDGNAVEFETSEGHTLRQEYEPDGESGFRRDGDPKLVPNSSQH